MEEYIDIVTKSGAPTGTSALKSEIHSKGYYHNTVHIWFYTAEGHILLQQRAATKAICPLLWDVSVAGHIDAGETLTHGAVREIEEEIGLTILETDLHKIGVFECFQTYPNGIIDNEFHHTFIAELKVDIHALVLQNEEVEAIKLVSIATFKDLLQHSETNGHFVASNRKYYEFVLERIQKRIASF
ncbi:NUDIX domain-containing protein [Lacinutrix neustonica]|uniref:NUDIX domain-containing protein n=1 Tax=Lacinutrix neustonica TaxID=2980107 RepID=A0A9E8MVD8_9FLAO|nr:NUDIX domain-containing protein [Lacinutrix neustonica]WAC02278.1 NUDIX domain-containing protein [Lacinutrix neustonica]